MVAWNQRRYFLTVNTPSRNEDKNGRPTSRACNNGLTSGMMSGQPYGLVVEQRSHHQITGEQMKLLSLADRQASFKPNCLPRPTGRYGLAMVRYPVLEVEARVEPFENGRGFSLRVLRGQTAIQCVIDENEARIAEAAL